MTGPRRPIRQRAANGRAFAVRRSHGRGRGAAAGNAPQAAAPHAEDKGRGAARRWATFRMRWSPNARVMFSPPTCGGLAVNRGRTAAKAQGPKWGSA
jgi:hypothetical protein